MFLIFLSVTIQDEAFSCTCGPDYSFASDLAATIGLTSISVITEIATPVSNTLMQLALRKLVLFEHSGAVPGSSYASEIAVVVNDGIFNSQTAISSIQVEYKNVGPTVFINEERVRCYILTGNESLHTITHFNFIGVEYLW